MGLFRLLRWARLGLFEEMRCNVLRPPGAPLARAPPPRARGCAVVSGATGGLGEATALALAAAGYHTIIGTRDLAQGDRVVREIRSRGGSADAALLELDDGCRAIASALRVARYKPNLLVNNAATMGASRSTTCKVNLVNTALFTLALLPSLSPYGETPPRVVNVASSSHLRAAAMISAKLLDDQSPDANLQAYAASKLGLMHFSEAIRCLDGARSKHRRNNARGLVVHDVHPGLVWTPMLRRQLGGLEPPFHRRIFKDASTAAATVVAAAVDETPNPRPTDMHHHRRADFQVYYVDARHRPDLASPESRDAQGVRHTWDALLAPHCQKHAALREISRDVGAALRDDNVTGAGIVYCE
ncbi:hypothetical protein M885DRAFT_611513 [Pelagophyceae sp. CCMP2097]|nr:hypothetical protein M885DRAFT_611513 [Pelagophyceae sp. CCMP2097]